MFVEISYVVNGTEKEIEAANERVRVFLTSLQMNGDIVDISMSDENGDII